MTLLARRHSSSHQRMMHLHARFFSKVLDGKFLIESIQDKAIVKLLAFSYPPYKDNFRDAAHFIGAYNKGGHHWVFVSINNVTNKITYIDPKGFEPPRNLLLNWQLFMTIFNKDVLKRRLEVKYKLKHSTSKLQGPEDNTNCGLYTLAVNIPCSLHLCVHVSCTH